MHGRTAVGGDNHNIRVMHAGHWGPRGLIYQSIHDRLLPPVPTPLNVLQHRSDSRRWPGGEGCLRHIIYTTIRQNSRLSGNTVYRRIYLAISDASAYGRYSHRVTTPNALLRRMLHVALKFCDRSGTRGICRQPAWSTFLPRADYTNRSPSLAACFFPTEQCSEAAATTTSVSSRR